MHQTDGYPERSRSRLTLLDGREVSCESDFESCGSATASDSIVRFDGRDSVFFRKLTQARIARTVNDADVV